MFGSVSTASAGGSEHTSSEPGKEESGLQVQTHVDEDDTNTPPPLRAIGATGKVTLS